MRAMVLRRAATDSRGTLALEHVRDATPRRGELLVEVSVCGVCRTDLDIADGRLTPPEYPVIPGHQVIGRVVALGSGVDASRLGQRVGVAWIHSACGTCRWCRAGTENLCPSFRSTGCDAPGGYAERLTVPAAFAYAIPTALSDVQAAPLLCAGAIGWRALRLARLTDGDPLGLTGFGASAHLVLQLARHRYPRSPLYVTARQEGERAFALELGASWVGDLDERMPSAPCAIIDTTPAWRPMIVALEQLAPGGRLVINAIRKSSADQDELMKLDYARHLWMEREVKSVANVTRADVREMLDIAARVGLRPTVEEVPLERAGDALEAMRRGESVHGARVVRVAGATA